MGVQVTGFQSLQVLFVETDEQLEELRREMFVVKDPNLIALSKHPVFPERADYFPSGFFRSTGETHKCDAWGTADYAGFKKILAEKFYGRPLPAIFEEPLPGPFFELLYFQENGQHYMMGPKTSEKLARDFADSRSQAEGLGGAFFNMYAHLQKACELSSRSGAVRFNASP